VTALKARNSVERDKVRSFESRDCINALFSVPALSFCVWRHAMFDHSEPKYLGLGLRVLPCLCRTPTGAGAPS